MKPDSIRLQFGNSEAVISRIGSALVSLTISGAELIPTPTLPRHPYHGVLLAPWPNRIARGEYAFSGTKYQPVVNEEFGNALHGLLFASEANVQLQTENQLVLESEITSTPSYPWNLTVRLRFELGEEGLSVETSATNKSEAAAPVGLGTHPFFVFDEDSLLEVRAETASVHGKDMIPVSEISSSEIGFGEGLPRPIEGVALDVQFTDVSKTCAVLTTKNWTLEIWQEGAKYLMVYTTDQYNWADGQTRAVAIEPQTCAADAFNNGQGLKVLEPGQSMTYRWGARRAK